MPGRRREPRPRRPVGFRRTEKPMHSTNVCFGVVAANDWRRHTQNTSSSYTTWTGWLTRRHTLRPRNYMRHYAAQRADSELELTCAVVKYVAERGADPAPR